MNRKYMFLALSVALCSSAFADNQLRIVDARGVTRAMSEIQDKARIEISIMDAQGKPATTQQAAIKLLNKQSPSVMMNSVARSGLAIFNNVEPGTWALATMTPGLTITNISMGSMAALSEGARASMGAVLPTAKTSSLAVAGAVPAGAGGAGSAGGAGAVAGGTGAAAAGAGAAGGLGATGAIAGGALGLGAAAAGSNEVSGGGNNTGGGNDNGGGISSFR